MVRVLVRVKKNPTAIIQATGYKTAAGEFRQFHSRSFFNRRPTLTRARDKPRDKLLGFVPVHSENIDFSDDIAEWPLARRELANAGLAATVLPAALAFSMINGKQSADSLERLAT